jgi:hypothetical protein
MVKIIYRTKGRGCFLNFLGAPMIFLQKVFFMKRRRRRTFSCKLLRWEKAWSGFVFAVHALSCYQALYNVCTSMIQAVSRRRKDHMCVNGAAKQKQLITSWTKNVQSQHFHAKNLHKINNKSNGDQKSSLSIWLLFLPPVCWPQFLLLFI